MGAAPGLNCLLHPTPVHSWEWTLRSGTPFQNQWSKIPLLMSQPRSFPGRTKYSCEFCLQSSELSLLFLHFKNSICVKLYLFTFLFCGSKPVCILPSPAEGGLPVPGSRPALWIWLRSHTHRLRQLLVFRGVDGEQGV